MHLDGMRIAAYRHRVVFDCPGELDPVDQDQLALALDLIGHAFQHEFELVYHVPTLRPNPARQTIFHAEPVGVDSAVTCALLAFNFCWNSIAAMAAASSSLPPRP